jgi:hypothetical protein
MIEPHQRNTSIVRHPSAVLYDAVFAAAIPAVSTYAGMKHVALRDDERAPVLRHAMEGLSRKTMRRILNGDEEAIRAIQLAINHSLDLVATMRMIAIVRGIGNLPPHEGTALVQAAEEMLRQRFANDKSPTMQVWGNPVEMTAAYVRAQLAELDRPLIKLPAMAAVRCTISRTTEPIRHRT